MVGWAPEPAEGWSGPVPVPEEPPVTVSPDLLAVRYDAVVIGSGPGGGTAGCLLAEAGRRVLVVEAGSWPSTAELSRDHLRNPRSDWGLLPLSGPEDDHDLRVLEIDGSAQVLRPYEPGWANNAMTAGGGSRIYGAQAWRFEPRDFAMASTYGVPDGSSLADWPIGYGDLEPGYAQAERELGVAGSSVMPTGPHRPPARSAAGRRGPVGLVLGAGPAAGQLRAVRRPAGLPGLPDVCGLRLPGRRQGGIAEHRAAPGVRDGSGRDPAADAGRAAGRR